MKRKPEAEKENSERWLLTYADMITLLMLFFVVLYSMSNIDIAKYRELSQALSTIFPGGGGSVPFFPGTAHSGKGLLKSTDRYPSGTETPMSKRKKLPRQIPIGKLLKKANVLLKPQIEDKIVKITEDERGLVITLTGDAYFDSGSARLKEDIKPVLEKVSEIINTVDNLVRIEGHTDNNPLPMPVKKRGYDTNWELSSSRSVNILRYMTEENGVNPKQLSSVAFAEYRPIDDNNTPEGRAYNRRVEIVILRDNYLTEGKTPGIERPLPDEEWR